MRDDNVPMDFAKIATPFMKGGMYYECNKMVA